MSIKNIYIEYKIDGSLSNAHSVTLSSEDGSYGVKEQDGTVVVPDGSSVLNSSTGLYEYSLNVENDIIYIISWKIIPSSGSDPIYTTQTIGPFSSFEESDIKVVPDFRGTFVQGSNGVLFLNICDVHGSPLTAEEISVTVSKDGDSIIDSVKPDFIKEGLYAFDWSIPLETEAGKYLVTWDYVVDDFSGTEFQEIIISSTGDDDNSYLKLYDSRISELRAALSNMISCAQNIPVYNEQGISDHNYSKFKFSFKRWNQHFGTRIYVNNIQVTEGIEINYFKGYVLFSNPLSSYDTVTADYNFRWFSDEQLDVFLQNAVSIINLYPPQTNYNLYNVLSIYLPLILYGASKDALRELLLCVNFQQPQQVFGGPENAKSAFSNFETLKKNFESEFTKLLEQKKFGKYPKTQGIVTPEFTLPGGRSRWFRYLFKGGS